MERKSTKMNICFQGKKLKKNYERLKWDSNPRPYNLTNSGSLQARPPPIPRGCWQAKVAVGFIEDL